MIFCPVFGTLLATQPGLIDVIVVKGFDSFGCGCEAGEGEGDYTDKGEQTSGKHRDGILSGFDASDKRGEC